MKITTKHSGYSAAGIRLYPKGGGDPGAAAREQEAERQSRIKAATASIDSIFNGSNREAMYADQRDTVYQLNKQDVERQAAEAERATRFGLARTGLMGGSAQIDANADLNRRTNEGLLQAGGIADNSAAELKSSDERTRSNLLSMAQSGIDTGSASTMALKGLEVNANQAAGQRAGATIGGLFNDMSQAYLSSQAGAGRIAGQNPNQQWYGVSAPQQTYSGNSR